MLFMWEIVGSKSDPKLKSLPGNIQSGGQVDISTGTLLLNFTTMIQWCDRKNMTADVLLLVIHHVIQPGPELKSFPGDIQPGGRVDISIDTLLVNFSIGDGLTQKIAQIANTAINLTLIQVVSTRSGFLLWNSRSKHY
jgi:hypothetical protein